jgi:hypothetical protein
MNFFQELIGSLDNVRYRSLNPKLYRIDTKRDKPIATHESKVFRGVDGNGRRIVLKIYDPTNLVFNHSTPVTLKTLETYQSLIGDVIDQMKGYKIVLTTSDKKEVTIQFSAVPILQIGPLVGTKFPSSICEEIAGSTLAGLHFENTELSKVPIPEIVGAVNNVDTMLKLRLQNSNINITAANVKTLPTEDPFLWHFVITDPCALVYKLNNPVENK